jgi:hypothetical protein
VSDDRSKKPVGDKPVGAVKSVDLVSEAAKTVAAAAASLLVFPGVWLSA